MTSHAFESALDDPDDHESHLRLRKLISCTNALDLTSPTVAEKYLRAFCNTASTTVRRRWIGVALARMMDDSPNIAKHLQQQRQELHGLGAILLGHTELEETRIMAGVIIRQGLEQGMDYGSFWLSDKVKNSAANFPDTCGSRWMSAFQDFLDTLDELPLTSAAADPSIIYPISIVTSDDFKWQPAGDGLAIALIQAGVMTMIVPDELLHNIRFLDVPIAHIYNVQSRPSSLYDSQARTIEHEPWDLTVALRGDAWTYNLDTSKQAGDEITILFQHSEDAREWETCIREHIKAGKSSSSRVHPMMSKSSPISGRRNPPQSSAVQATQGQKQIYQLQASPYAHSPSFDRRSNPISRSTSRSSVQNTQVAHDQDQEELLGQAAAKGSMARRDKYGNASLQKRKSLSSAQESIRNCLTELKGTKSTLQEYSGQTTQGADSLDSGGTPNKTVPPDHSSRTQLTSKQAIHNKGKLRKVSRATKLRAAQQLHPQSDMPDLAEKREEQLGTNLQAFTTIVSSSGANQPKQSQKPKVSPHKPATRSKGSKLQPKRKAADDDEDYVPDEEKPRKQTKRKRKSKSDTIGEGSVRPKKKARAEIVGGARLDQETGNPMRPSVKIQKSTQIYSGKSRHPEATLSEKLTSRIHSSRHPLIDGLLGSQQPLSASTTKSMKSSPPMQSCSTPAQHQSRLMETHCRPQSSNEVQKRTKDVMLVHDYSSPTPQNGTKLGGKHRKPSLLEQAKILSSNSKLIPASPNAESTAISGHADGTVVNFEKERGDLQTAQSNPFIRQRNGQNTTSFVRRLTGDKMQEDKSVPGSQYQSTLKKIDTYDESSAKEITYLAVSTQLPQLHKESTQTSVANPARENDTQATVLSGSAVRIGTVEDGNISHPNEIHPQPSRISHDKQASLLPQRKTNAHISVGNRSKPIYNSYNAYNQSPTQTTLKNRISPSEAQIALPNTVMVNTSLTGRRHLIEETQPNKAVEKLGDVNLDGETTLIGGDEDGTANFTVHFHSSPPILRSFSSRSSTSAERTPTPQPSLPTSEVEDVEWESTLQPHQRALHDLLMRTSKRVLRHIVDNETAVIDIMEVFAKDGEYVLNTLLRQHEDDYDRVFHRLKDKAKGLKEGLELTLKQLAKERGQISAMI